LPADAYFGVCSPQTITARNAIEGRDLPQIMKCFGFKPDPGALKQIGSLGAERELEMSSLD